MHENSKNQISELVKLNWMLRDCELIKIQYGGWDGSN